MKIVRGRPPFYKWSIAVKRWVISQTVVGGDRGIKMAQHDYFPLFFSMENKNIFIIGGGRVAEIIDSSKYFVKATVSAVAFCMRGR